MRCCTGDAVREKVGVEGKQNIRIRLEHVIECTDCQELAMQNIVEHQRLRATPGTLHSLPIVHDDSQEVIRQGNIHARKTGVEVDGLFLLFLRPVSCSSANLPEESRLTAAGMR